jgi:hypothetical protein
MAGDFAPLDVTRRFSVLSAPRYALWIPDPRQPTPSFSPQTAARAAARDHRERQAARGEQHHLNFRFHQGSIPT